MMAGNPCGLAMEVLQKAQKITSFFFSCGGFSSTPFDALLEGYFSSPKMEDTTCNSL
jgi:hypothetical protein